MNQSRYDQIASLIDYLSLNLDDYGTVIDGNTLCTDSGATDCVIWKQDMVGYCYKTQYLKTNSDGSSSNYYWNPLASTWDTFKLCGA